MSTKPAVPETQKPQPRRILPVDREGAVSAPAFSARHFAPAPELPELPPDLAGCLALWSQMQHHWKVPNLDPRWRKFIAELRQRSHALQQGLPLTEIGQQAGKDRAAYICSAESRRLTERTAYQNALDANFDGEPLGPIRPIAEVLAVYVTTEGLDQARALRQALASYGVKFVDLFALHSPRQRHEERKIALASRPSPEVSRRIADEAALEANPIFPQLAHNARTELLEFYQAEIQPKEVALLQGAIKFTEGCKEASVNAEKAFFASAGVPYEQTGVSRRFDSTLAELQFQLERVTQTGSRVRTVAGTSVNTRNAGDSILSTIFACPILLSPEEWMSCGSASPRPAASEA